MKFVCDDHFIKLMKFRKHISDQLELEIYSEN